MSRDVAADELDAEAASVDVMLGRVGVGRRRRRRPPGGRRAPAAREATSERRRAVAHAADGGPASTPAPSPRRVRPLSQAVWRSARVLREVVLARRAVEARGGVLGRGRRVGRRGRAGKRRATLRRPEAWAHRPPHLLQHESNGRDAGDRLDDERGEAVGVRAGQTTLESRWGSRSSPSTFLVMLRRGLRAS